MRVLMIGGTGLIGSSITQQLLARGDDVTVYGRGQSQRVPAEGARLLLGDRTSPRFQDDMARAGTFDCVVDMVCYRPEEATAAVTALRGRTAQYVLTSTIDVYRKPAASYPYREDEPHEGRGAYARQKVECERVVRAAHDEDGFPATIIRPAATYGDRHLPVHSLGRSTTYLDRLRRGRPIVVHGDGSSFWVSCHADDVARGFAGAIGNDHAIGRAYHVTGEEWLTWDQHHRAVARAVGGPEPELVHIPTDALARLAPERASLAVENLQFNNVFDTSSARHDLGFRQTISLEEGLPGWYRSLEDAALIEDCEADPYDDRVIDLWQRALVQASGDRAVTSA